MEIIKILVVDDEEEICELTRTFLRKKNYCTFGANSGEEALEVIRKEHPHIALLDVRLGSDSGIDVLGRIKEIDKKVKVIMVTALNDEESMKQAKALGADDYIVKPFTSAYLNDLILKKIADLTVNQ
ncbi:MAG: response regulator [Candidatus Omnitrophota bacterium]